VYEIIILSACPLIPNCEPGERMKLHIINKENNQLDATIGSLLKFHWNFNKLPIVASS
jgi:transcription termination factor NusB